MNSFRKKLLSLTLAVMLCLLPFASLAESLFHTRANAALDAGRNIETTIGLELNDSVGMILHSEELFNGIKDVLSKSTITLDVAKTASGEQDLGFTLTLADKQILTGHARQTGDKLAIETSLLPGKTLLITSADMLKLMGKAKSQLQSTITMPDMTALSQALTAASSKYLGIVTAWATSAPDMMTNSEEAVPATDARDAATSCTTIRVTPEQFKALLSTLADEFSRDEALQAALSGPTTLMQSNGKNIADAAKEWAASINAMETTGKPSELKVYTNGDQLVGIDATILSLSASDNGQGTLTYDQKTTDSVTAQTFKLQGVGTSGDTSTVTWNITKNMTDAKAPKGNWSMAFDVQTGADAAKSNITLSGEYAATLAEGQETYQSQFKIAASPATGATTDPSNNAILLALSAGAQFDTISKTEALDGNNFQSQNETSVSVMGFDVGKVKASVVTTDYVPADTSANTIVEVGTLDEAGLAALSNEMKQGLVSALGSAFSALPASLQNLIAQKGTLPAQQ